jgi:hypothetical protein
VTQYCCKVAWWAAAVGAAGALRAGCCAAVNQVQHSRTPSTLIPTIVLFTVPRTAIGSGRDSSSMTERQTHAKPHFAVGRPVYLDLGIQT